MVDVKNLIIKIPAIISKITTMMDGSLQLRVDTQEISADDKVSIFNLHNKIGWFVFKEANLKEEDLVDLPEIKFEKNVKTPSQRLRAVIYLHYQRNTNAKEDFETFYRKEIEKLINYYKQKLQ